MVTVFVTVTVTGALYSTREISDNGNGYDYGYGYVWALFSLPRIVCPCKLV